MKKVLVFLFTLCYSFYLNGQAPQLFNYQAGVYDASGQPMANHQIGLNLFIHDTASTGPIIYGESFLTTTDVNGLFSVNIGGGNVLNGIFANIDWAHGAKWLRTKIDTSGTGTYILMGVSQFLSVPYALHADNNLTGFDAYQTNFVADTVYFATTDGFVNVRVDGQYDVFNCETATVLNDNTPNPTYPRAIWYNMPGNLIVPVKKNSYWKVLSSQCAGYLDVVSITFLPLK